MTLRQNYSRFYPLLISIICIAILALFVKALSTLGYGITYAVTKSMPNGFYLLIPPKNLNRYDIVVFNPPLPALNFLYQHHLAPKSGRLIKYIFAMPHDAVCKKDNCIWINNRKIGKIYTETAEGIKLPQYNFCGNLGEDQYFLLSIKVPNSFDSRYFGPVAAHDILSKAVPLFKFVSTIKTGMARRAPTTI